MTREEALIRCYGCDYYTIYFPNNLYCSYKGKPIFNIEKCAIEFTCPKHCKCVAQPNEPLPCEIGPEQIEHILKTIE